MFYDKSFDQPMIHNTLSESPGGCLLFLLKEKKIPCLFTKPITQALFLGQTVQDLTENKALLLRFLPA